MQNFSHEVRDSAASGGLRAMSLLFPEILNGIQVVG